MYALLNDAIQHMLGSSIIPKLSLWILVQYYKVHLSITGTASPGTTDNISLRTAPNRAGTPLTGSRSQCSVKTRKSNPQAHHSSR